jgi:hypothetical protein
VRLLNVLERHLSVSHTLLIARPLLTTNLLYNRVEVATDDGDMAVVGAESGLTDVQGPLIVGAGASQVAQFAQHETEVVVPGGHGGVVGARGWPR